MLPYVCFVAMLLLIIKGINVEDEWDAVEILLDKVIVDGRERVETW